LSVRYDCCGEINDIWHILKKRYPEISVLAQTWWNEYRQAAGSGWYQQYPAENYILKMMNILWGLDQEYKFLTVHQFLDDGLFEI